MEFAASRIAELERSDSTRWHFWCAVVVSIGLHGLLLLVWQFDNARPPTSSPTAIAVNLVPERPKPESAPQPEYTPILPPEIEQRSLLPALPEPEPAIPIIDETPPVVEAITNSAVELAESVELPRIAETAVEPEVSGGISRAPTLETIQSAANSALSRRWQRPECEPLEEYSGWRDCKPVFTGEPRAISLADELNTYSSLNPLRETSSTERSLPVMTANMNRLNDGLMAQGIDGPARNQLLEQVDAVISLYSDPDIPVRRQQRLMMDKSGVTRRAEQIVNDPWVVTQRLQRAQRQKHQPVKPRIAERFSMNLAVVRARSRIPSPC